MGFRHRHTTTRLLAGFALLAVVGSLAWAHAVDPAAPPTTSLGEQGFGEVPWTELAYSARKFFLGAETVIRAGRLLPDPGRGLASIPVGRQVLPRGRRRSRSP
jgi:hypothetical protein